MMLRATMLVECRSTPCVLSSRDCHNQHIIQGACTIRCTKSGHALIVLWRLFHILWWLDPLVQADAAALRSAAPALNKFPTDGSFLDSALGERARPISNPLQAALQAGHADRQSPTSSPDRGADREAGNKDRTSIPQQHESSPSPRPGREQGARAPDEAARDGTSGVSLVHTFMPS